jgi:hypothetical protein
MEEHPGAVFQIKGDYTFENVFHVCDKILQYYLEKNELPRWALEIESGRLLDALRLIVTLSNSARIMLSPLKYRAERATLMTRWLKVSLDKHSITLTSKTSQSEDIVGFGGKTLEEIVGNLETMDRKDSNSIASELIRYV